MSKHLDCERGGTAMCGCGQMEDKPAKCRMAEVLGVEVGERVIVPGRVMEMSVDGDKDLNWHMDDHTQPFGDFELLLDLIADPSIIIRKPRFSDDELAMLRCFAAAGVERIERLGVAGGLRAFAPLKQIEDGTAERVWWIPDNLFLAIHPGESITLAELLEATTCTK